MSNGIVGDEWEIEGPSEGQPQVRLWSTHYIPFERLMPGERAARGALQEHIRLLAPARGEILHATYAGYKPTGMDIENLVLYNVGNSCFRPGTKHGVRFEVGGGPWPEPPSGRRFSCYYSYRLVNPHTDLNGQPSAHTVPFSVFLTLDYPSGRPVAAIPELVKALIDGTVVSFQAHGNRSSLSELAARLSATTGQPSNLIAHTLLDDRRAVLGVTDNLLYLRGDGVQWNPSDQLCVAGQVLVRPAPSTTWTLAGQIHAVEPAQ